MEPKEKLPSYRLRVEKNIEKKALLLKLSFNYFFVFVGLVFANLGLLLINFSGKTLFFVILFIIISYVVVKYLDNSDMVDNLSSKKLPNSIENNLYELKNESRPVIK